LVGYCDINKYYYNNTVHNEKTKLLVIAMTATVIIAAATITSLSAATPAFAKINCDVDSCIGGTSLKQAGVDAAGGHGGREITDLEDPSTTSVSGGGGGEFEFDVIGGAGSHFACKSGDCTDRLGGQGLHVKGPGGNSGNAPPP
jgi:hypothetical protein